jgi:serine/threonine protein kinase/tetratricopeptide (TPR) repeat protein
MEPACPHAVHAGMKTMQWPEGRPSPIVCAQCGSQFSSIDDKETFCATCLLQTALSSEDVDYTPGPHQFDQYELITGNNGAPIELGRGAMGVTYKALDTNLRCEVALKVIHPRYLADKSTRARFLSEARAAAQLRHRNIASVFHLGSERGDYFYAMELVDGETIEDRVRCKGPIDCATALDITLQITRALIAAGDRKFVHRDVKPSNVMLCTEADGAIVAKLIDFGLVRAISDQAVSASASPTRGGFIGTPHFASPEQFAGRTTDARSDIYSLGVTLWYMLSGKLPLGGTREEIQRQQLSGVLPLEQLKGISRTVVDLIKRMLETDPAKRPQSPAVLKDQLNNCITAIDAIKQKERRRFTYSALAASMLIIAALGASYILQHKVVPNAANEIVPEKSIAVLPFENLSDDKEHAFFADGVQDDILTKLAKVADLKVISRTSVMQYRGKHDMRQIGRELVVAHVLEGTVRRSGIKVHVNAQLVDARTNTHVWAEEYDRDLNDVFAIEAELAQSIASQLRANVSTRETVAIQQRPTPDLVAYDLYTRAKNLIPLAGFGENGKQDLLAAADLLDEAVRHDPSFFDAYCQLARVDCRLYVFGLDHSPERFANAEVAVEAAARLRPDAGEAHLARAENLYAGHLDYEAALAELEIAQKTLPNDARVFQLMGYVQRRQGRWEQSMQNLDRAVELSPRDLETLQQTALSYAHFSRYAEVAKLLDRVCVIEPTQLESRVARASIDFDWKADIKPMLNVIDEIRAKNPESVADTTNARLVCALAERDAAGAKDALLALGERPLEDDGGIEFTRSFVEGLIARMANDDEKAHAAFTAARAEQEKIVESQPSFGPPWCVLGLIDAALGRTQEALREGNRAVELVPVKKDAVTGSVMIKYLAMTAAWAGDKDLAFEQLTIAVGPPSFVGYGELKLLPWWDPLRGDPRFEKIVASLAPK